MGHQIQWYTGHMGHVGTSWDMLGHDEVGDGFSYMWLA